MSATAPPANTPVEEQPSNPVAPADAVPQVQVEQPDQYQLRELTAQELIADASVWMAGAAALTFLVTTIGTILIWRQVKLTRNAVKETAEATQAMRDANEIAREIGQAQVRAYLEFINPYVEITKRNIPKVGFCVRNYGSSPALEFTAKLTMRITMPNEEPVELPPIATKAKNIAAGNEPVEIHPVAFREGTTAEMRDGFCDPDTTIGLWLFINAEWKDVFGEKGSASLAYSTLSMDWEVGEKRWFMTATDLSTAVRNEISDRGYRENREDLD